MSIPVLAHLICLRENSREQLKTLIAELAAKKDNAPSSAAQKVGDL